MEGTLVSAAGGALKPVLEKLGAVLSDKYKLVKSVRSEIKSLKAELEAMHAFLENMSELEDSNVQDKVWMADVRELSYDIEDSIDEFMFRVDDKSAKPGGLIKKCKNLLMKTKTHRMAKKIRDLKIQVNEVGERHARYKIRETISKTSNAAVDHRAVAIFQDASKLVGIDGPKDVLIKLLMHGDVCASLQQPKVVSIIGSAGLGKTTLANQVYKKLGEQFECKSFVSVSQNPDMMKVLRIILSEVSNQPYASTEEGGIEQLISKIANFLEDKRSVSAYQPTYSSYIHKYTMHGIQNIPLAINSLFHMYS